MQQTKLQMSSLRRFWQGTRGFDTSIGRAVESRRARGVRGRCADMLRITQFNTVLAGYSMSLTAADAKWSISKRGLGITRVLDRVHIQPRRTATDVNICLYFRAVQLAGS